MIIERIIQVKLFAPTFGPRVRSLLEEAGLSEIDNMGMQVMARGGELPARQYSMSLLMLVARGIFSHAECADIQKACEDPSFSFITRSTFAAWGKRAS